MFINDMRTFNIEVIVCVCVLFIEEHGFVSMAVQLAVSYRTYCMKAAACFDNHLTLSEDIRNKQFLYVW